MLPELRVRKWLHCKGYRYRLHKKGLPGKPDIVFGSRRKVIFVHGCFWHQHDKTGCLDGRAPKTRLDYWNNKLRTNVERDERVRLTLIEMGWQVLVVWECETKDIEALGERLLEFLE